MPRLESEKSRRRREVRLGLRASGGSGSAGMPPRTPLDKDAAASFFEAIDAKDAPRFGLVKLAALDLDVLHAAPVRAQEPGGALTAWAPAITLLGYAALRRTDGIVAALLRAGADPSVRWTNAGPAATAGVRAYAGSLRPSYGVWVARKVVGMRRAGALASAGANAATGCCSVCAEPGAQQLLAWDGVCGHLRCEPCFWRPQMTHDHVACGGNEARCPACAPAAVTAASWLGAATCSTAAERAERKAASAQKWLALAATKAEAEAQAASAKTKSKRAKGGRIRALKEREAAALNPGWLRSDRVERLNEAACADDVLRLLGILEAGVDIDGRSECGETAAISAAMLGNARSLRVLCWAGADLSIADAGGATPASAAAARGHEAALVVVREFTVGCLPVDFPCVPAAQPPIVVEPAASCFRSLIDRCEHPVHPGCGSGYVDNGFSTGWLRRLDDMWAVLPAHIADATARNTSSKSYAMTCATRSLFCDTEGWVEAELAPLAKQLMLHTAAAGMELAEIKILPRMRFLCYKSQGGNMQPHVDLAKRDPSGSGTSNVRLSTHTFMVHLADCKVGGETVLLSKLTGAVADLGTGGSSGEGQLPDGVLAAVSPVRGRLLIFPHLCPHAGLPVDSVPKLFLRGELLVAWKDSTPTTQLQTTVVDPVADAVAGTGADANADPTAVADVPLRMELPAKQPELELEPEPEPDAPPMRLGTVRRPAFENLLWRLVDHGICPRIVPGTSWCEPLDTQGFFSELPTSLDPGASRSKGPLPPERAHRKRAQIVAIIKLVEALLPLPSEKDGTGERPLVVDFCGGGGHLGLVLSAR